MTEMRNQEVTKEQPLLDENGKDHGEPGMGDADRCGNMTGDSITVARLPDQRVGLLSGDERRICGGIYFVRRRVHRPSVSFASEFSGKMGAYGDDSDAVSHGKDENARCIQRDRKYSAYRDKRTPAGVPSGRRGDAGFPVTFKDFCQGKPFYCEIALEQPPMDTY